jgi:serine/tyrosine/threonine adenylyltransferase
MDTCNSLQRLGLRRQDPTDESKLFKPLLGLMESSQLDFHSTFRTLSSFKPSLLALPQDPTPNSTNSKESPISIALHQFITNILSATPEPQRLDYGAVTGEWLGWLERYATRIKDEEAEWTAAASAKVDIDIEREQEMKNVNPRFVLRQWLLEEVIGKVERDSDSGKKVLAKVMHVSYSRTFKMKDIYLIFIYFCDRWHVIRLNLGVRKKMLMVN